MKNSNRLSLILFPGIACFLCGIMLPAASRSPSGNTDSLSRYLPVDAATDPWRAEGAPRSFKDHALYEYINGGAEIFHEYGFVQMVAQRYVLGDNAITVDIYEMNHPRAAFGIYSVKRDPAGPALQVGDAGTDSDTSVSFCSGRFYVAITSDSPSSDARKASIRFAHDISRRMDRSSRLPNLLEMLPAARLLPGSQGYAGGLLGLNTQCYISDSNILGIDGRTVECVFGQYQIGADRATLLVIRYPDPPAATVALRAAADAFKDKYQSLAMEGIQAYRDRRNRIHCLAVAGRFLYVISGADSMDLARGILSSTAAEHIDRSQRP